MTTPGEFLRSLVMGLAPADADGLGEALASETIDSTASAFVIRDRLQLSDVTSTAVARLLREAVRTTGSADAARWLVVGMTSIQPASARPALVWTSPLASPPTRDTAAVLRERVALAHDSIVIVGYSLTAGAEAILTDLAEAATRGVRLWLVADRMEDKLPALEAHWPDGLRWPELWSRPEDKADAKSALHAKVAIFDQEWLLITSANLTYHGLRGNLEMGVLLRGQVAVDATELVRQWTTHGLVRKVVPHPGGSPPTR